MKTQLQFAGLPAALVLALVGCEKTTAPAPLPEAVAVPLCEQRDTKRSTCVEDTCTLSVSVNDKGGIVVDPYELMVPNKEVNIVWELKDPQFEFTDADGPKDIKNRVSINAPIDKDFLNGTPVTKLEGLVEGTRGTRYKIKFKSHTESQRWSYTIQFRGPKPDDTDKGKSKVQVYRCDPYINNQGG